MRSVGRDDRFLCVVMGKWRLRCQDSGLGVASPRTPVIALCFLFPCFPGNPISFPFAEAAAKVRQHQHWFLESWGICFWHKPQKCHYFQKVIREQLHRQETSWRDSYTSPFPVSGSGLTPILGEKTDFNLWEYESFWGWGFGSGWDRRKQPIIYQVLWCVMHIG